MKKSTKKWGIAVIISGIIIAMSTAAFMFYQPHRDVQSSATDVEISATQLVNEYLKEIDSANQKYLQEEGESKIISVTGIVALIEEDMNQQKVVLLKDAGSEAGVSCTFTHESNARANKLKIGEEVTIKGVIRSGAEFDEDLEMYEHVIMEKCDII